MKLKGFLTMKNQLIYMTINNDNSILRFLYSNKIYLYLKKHIRELQTLTSNYKIILDDSKGQSLKLIQ